MPSGSSAAFIALRQVKLNGARVTFHTAIRKRSMVTTSRARVAKRHPAFPFLGAYS